MKLICMHCKKTLKTFHDDELSVLLNSDAGVYFFCNKDCKDKWFQPATSQDEISNIHQASV